MNNVQILTRNGRVRRVTVDGVEVCCTRIFVEDGVDQIPVVHMSILCNLHMEDESDGGEDDCRGAE